jgi:hypothetical protein
LRVQEFVTLPHDFWAIVIKPLQYLAKIRKPKLCKGRFGMRSDDLAEKLGKQFALFGQGRDKKIKHKELEKIIAKLTPIRDGLADLASSAKSSKKAEKLAAERDGIALLIERAAWLVAQLPAPAAEGHAEASEAATDAPQE